MTIHPALRYAATYGLLSGAVIIATLITTLNLGGHNGITGTLWFGYTVMLVAMTFVFVGIKRYRDIERGGVIGFLAAFGTGLAIAIMAGIVYVAIWEAYLAISGYHFMDDYTASILKAKQAAGMHGAALAAEKAKLDAMRAQYANPLFRLPMTFAEVFPVGFLVALVSAIVLRNPRFLPARA